MLLTLLISSHGRHQKHYSGRRAFFFKAFMSNLTSHCKTYHLRPSAILFTFLLALLPGTWHGRNGLGRTAGGGNRCKYSYIYQIPSYTKPQAKTQNRYSSSDIFFTLQLPLNTQKYPVSAKKRLTSPFLAIGRFPRSYGYPTKLQGSVCT